MTSITVHREAVAAPPRKIICRKRHQSGDKSDAVVVDIGVLSTPSCAVQTRRWTLDGSNSSSATDCTKDEGVAALPDAVTMPFPPRDFAWCPFLEDGEQQPCWLMASKSAPIMLWDPTEGCARATYRAYNAMDEHVSPYSLLWPTSAPSSSLAASKRSAPSSHSTAFYAGYGSVEDTAAHVRCFDAAVEGRQCTWFYRSRYMPHTTSIVSHLTAAMHATNPNLLGIGYSGGGGGHVVEIMDIRHRKTATLLQPVGDGNKPLTHLYNGTACIRASHHNPWHIFTAPRLTSASNAQLPVFTWDIRRSSTPLRTVVVDDAPIEPCGAFFDVVSSTSGRDVIVAATQSRGLALLDEASVATYVGTSQLLGASTVSVVHADDAIRRIVVAVGGGGRSLADVPLRDRWEENEGRGISLSGHRRGRDGSLILPMDDASDELPAAAEGAAAASPWLATADITLE